MRPIKELLLEEYWNIAYRFCNKNECIFNNTDKAFLTLPKSKRYWYADPFIFEYNDKVYLFVEMFDNMTEKGVIGYSVLNNGVFSTPEVILEEPFHLSYPNVFENNGDIYMMPETMGDKCIQIYRADVFPTKWVKDKVLINIENAVDTVFLNDWLITSIVTDAVKKKTRLELYQKTTGIPHKKNPVRQPGQLLRGAGACFNFKGNTIRPAQNCKNSEYGAGLIFYKIDKINYDDYVETEFFNLKPQSIKLKYEKSPKGTHTYAKSGSIEILDYRKKRLNFRRLLWIVKTKLN